MESTKFCTTCNRNIIVENIENYQCCLTCGEIVNNPIQNVDKSVDKSLNEPKKYRKNSRHLKNKDNLSIF